MAKKGFKSFKEYIENRTTEDIMEDYGEQRDEWEPLLERKGGNVVRFKHRNGRTFFCTQYEAECDDIADALKKANAGQTIEEQMQNFYVTESIKLSKTAYGDITKEQLRRKAIKLSEYDGIVELILKGDILIGAVVKGHFGNDNLLLGQSVCTYYASDNEGSGCNEREDYIYLTNVKSDV